MRIACCTRSASREKQALSTKGFSLNVMCLVRMLWSATSPYFATEDTRDCLGGLLAESPDGEHGEQPYDSDDGLASLTGGSGPPLTVDLDALHAIGKCNTSPITHDWIA